MMCNLALHTQATTFPARELRGEVKFEYGILSFQQTESPIKSSFEKYWSYFCVLFWLLFNRCRRAEFIKKT